MLVLFISLWTIAGILIVTDPKNRSTRWGSAIAFFSGFGGLGVLLRDYANTLNDITIRNYILTGTAFMFTLSHQVAPYALMVYGIVYSDFFMKYGAFLKYVPYILFAPVALMYMIFPFIPEYEPSFLILSLWVVPYVLTANFLLIYSFINERNERVKLQRLLTCIVITPTTLFAIAANYILRVFGSNNLWQYNMVTITAVFIIFVFSSLKYGVMGVKLKFEQYRLDSAIRSITSGTTMLNHTLKNEILKIGMCTNNVKTSVNSTDKNLKEINENLDYILESTEFVTRMVKQIQAHVQDIILEKRVNNFREILSGALDMIKPLINDKKITVENSITNDVCVKCDAIHIQEVLHNLFRNSIEAMDTGGRIKIEINENKKNIVISIKDSGSGISKDNLPHIFDPFFSTKRTGVNFGLGLSYSFNVMQQHGGKLEISSERNIGTTVLLIFPKAKGAALRDNLLRRSVAGG